MLKKTPAIIEKELVIIGGGPAGLAAALAAHENGVKDILLLERDQFLGGILNQCLHTGFGLQYFKEELTGPEYAERFIQKIQAVPEIEISLKSLVVDLKISPSPANVQPAPPAKFELVYLKPGSLETIICKTLIMATGCRERTREMIQISGTRPAGIFSAGLAQKLINLEGLLPGREVIIVGSGDIGLIMARRFTLEGARVAAIVEAQPQSRGLIRNLVQCVEDFEIPIYFNSRVSKILGTHRVTGVEVTPATGPSFEINGDTVLVSVGLIPENELIEKIDRNTPGLFNCGNSSKVYDLVDWVTVDSLQTGQAAAAYLRSLA